MPTTTFLSLSTDSSSTSFDDRVNGGVAVAPIYSVPHNATNTDSNGIDKETDTAATNATTAEDYYNPNGIRPRTMTLPHSIAFFAHFVVASFVRSRKQRRFSRAKSRLLGQSQFTWFQKWSQSLSKLNEQRRALVELADYSASIVAPSFVSLTIGALLVSIIPHYYAQCIQLVATLDSRVPVLLSALTGLFVTTTAAAAFTGLRGSLFWIAGSRANYNVRIKLHRNLLLQEAAFFDANEAGYLLSRLNSDVNKIGQVISYHVNVVFRQFAQFLFGSVYLIRIAPWLSLYTFAGIALVAILSAVYGDFNRDLAQRVQDTFANATAVAETSFSLSETIRAFDGVATESSKYEAAQCKALELEEVQAWGYGSHKFISDTLEGLLQMGTLAACWYLGRAGSLPAEKLTKFIFYSWFVLESSNEVGDQWAKIQGAVGASTSVFDLIRRVPAVRDPPRCFAPMSRNVTLESQQALPVELLPNARSIPTLNGQKAVVASSIADNERNSVASPSMDGTPPIIRMSNVSLTYENMVIPALSGVDLNIYNGDRLAIVGRSGSGKSSMLRSILRFYDPTIGAICLSGVPLTQMTRREIANKISVVEQEPALFPMTLMENVLYGIDKDAVDEATGEAYYSERYQQAVIKALDAAGLSIHPGNDLNLDLSSRVGEGGRALSGGQRQRVAIARALIRDPQVLLLDEPTAALDSESERTVIKALLRAMEHADCMAMVTHRLNIVSALGVNRVIVMDKGRIVEMGHPEDLIRQEKGLYASLAREQGITIQEPIKDSNVTPL
jgi:ABC-type multidrug transport system fused ATPase/permease subunit